MKFLHCSDIHLGTWRFKTDHLREDFSIAFEAMIEDAIARKVDFLLISGDFFNKQQIDPETLIAAEIALDRLREAGIDTLAVEGNHDASIYSEQPSWLNFLSKRGFLKLLQIRYKSGAPVMKAWDEQEKIGAFIDIGDIRIYGLGYLGASATKKMDLLQSHIKPSEFTVAMLHAGINMFNNMDMGGVAQEDVEKLQDKVDYVALGHIHYKYSIDDWMFNPGGLENWRVDEAKRPKGYFIVDVNKGKMKPEFIPSKRRPAHILEVDITSCTCQKDIADSAKMVVDGCAELDPSTNPIVSLRYTGKPGFRTQDIDNEPIRSWILQRANAAECIINDDSDLYSTAPSGLFQPDRIDIEKEEVGKLLEGYGTLPYDRDELITLVRQFKSTALIDEDEEELMALTRALVEKRRKAQ